MESSSWSQLGGLMFVARRAVEGLWAGRHASPRLGSGQEFHDYRAYSPGDDVRDLDWKVLGRTDRLYLRRHQLLTDMQAYLMVDVSASMAFAGLDASGRAMECRPGLLPSKLQYAEMLAAAIAFLTVRQSDRAGVGLMARGLSGHLPPAGSWSHLRQVISMLESATPAEGEGDLGAALRQAHRLLRRRGVVIVISDFLDEPEGVLDGLARLRHGKFDVIALQVLTRQELDLGGIEDLSMRLVDPETQRGPATRVGGVAEEYRRLMREHITRLSRRCGAMGVDYSLLTTDQSVTWALRRHLLRRSAMAR